jgi:hypothetical protein
MVEALVLALFGQRIIHERALALVGHHAPPGRSLDIIIAVGAAPEHALAAAWRFLTIRQSRAILGSSSRSSATHPPRGRTLDVAIIVGSRCCSRAVGLVAIGVLGKQPARSVPVTKR